MTKVAEDARTPGTGLPEGTGPSPLSLEIQAYDELCVPGLAAEWADQVGDVLRRGADAGVADGC